MQLTSIQKILTHNGPSPSEYAAFSEWFEHIKTEIELGQLTKEEKEELRRQFGEVLSSNQTIFGHGYNKPHGYAGDYEMIEKVYNKYISCNPRFIKYDLFSQQQACSIAVRNRKEYFKNLLCSKATQYETLSVLNLASGPCRGIKELLDDGALQNTKIHCIDIDKNAVQYAQCLLESDPRITFETQNVFQYLPSKKYDLIWSAGLFDYFDDETFVRILQRFLAFVTEGGEMIVGNFHPSNPSRAYMEFGEWYLYHRTQEELIVLAQQAGITDVNRITIEKEKSGVNLFIRIRF